MKGSYRKIFTWCYFYEKIFHEQFPCRYKYFKQKPLNSKKKLPLKRTKNIESPSWYLQKHLFLTDFDIHHLDSRSITPITIIKRRDFSYWQGSDFFPSFLLFITSILIDFHVYFLLYANIRTYTHKPTKTNNWCVSTKLGINNISVGSTYAYTLFVRCRHQSIWILMSSCSACCSHSSMLMLTLKPHE